MEDLNAKTANNGGGDSDTTVDGFFVKDDAETSETKTEDSSLKVLEEPTKSLPGPMTDSSRAPAATRVSDSARTNEDAQPKESNGDTTVTQASGEENTSGMKSDTPPIVGTVTVAELTAEAIAESALELTQDLESASTEPPQPAIDQPAPTAQEQAAPKPSPTATTQQPRATSPSAISKAVSRPNLPDQSPILKLAPKLTPNKRQTPVSSPKHTAIAPKPGKPLAKNSGVPTTPNQSDKLSPPRNQQPEKQLLKLAPKPTKKPTPSPKSKTAAVRSQPSPGTTRRRLAKTSRPKKQSPRSPYTSTMTNPTQNPRSFKLQTIGSRQIGGIQDQAFADRTPACSCARDSSRMMTSKKKTACLKLYCPCFSHGSYCTERCACSSACSNHSDAEEIRTRAISETLYKDNNAFRLEAGKTSELQHLVRTSLFRGNPPSFIASDQSFATQDPDAFVRSSLLSTQLQPSYYTMPCKVSASSKVEVRSVSFSLTHPQTGKGRPRRKRGVSQITELEADSDKRRIVLSPTGLETRAARSDALAMKYLQAIKQQRHPDSLSTIGDPFSHPPITSVAADVTKIRDAMDAAYLKVTTGLFKEDQLQTEVVKEWGLSVAAAAPSPPALQASSAKLPTEDTLAHLYCDEALDSAPVNKLREESEVEKIDVASDTNNTEAVEPSENRADKLQNGSETEKVAVPMDEDAEETIATSGKSDNEGKEESESKETLGNSTDERMEESETKRILVSLAEDTAMIEETTKIIRRFAHALSVRRTKAKKK